MVSKLSNEEFDRVLKATKSKEVSPTGAGVTYAYALISSSSTLEQNCTKMKSLLD